MSLSLELRKYKEQNGSVNFREVLCIPFNDRLHSLVKSDYKRTHKVIGAAIQLSMESMNLAKPLTPNQIFDLVDNILDSSTEDYLGLEDIVLFLQQLVRGESGQLFSSIDIPKFMHLFENYRQKRHSEFIRLKEEKEAQLKCTPITGRLSEGMRKNSDIDSQTFFSLMETYQSGKNE